MLFKKSLTELNEQSINDLQNNTEITNMSIGGVARTMLEVINKQLSDYYNVLDINQAMGFLSSAEGYFLDLIGDLFNMPRLQSETASATAADETQRFYVTRGVLGDYIPGLQITTGTKVSTSDDQILFTVTADVSFDAAATEVYVPIESDETGASQNVGKNALIKHDLGLADVYTVNDKALITGSDTEDDNNYRYRISNATLSAEKANETAIRLAALSVDGVSDVVMSPFARGMGSYDVLVVPTEGLADDSLIAQVQTAIEEVQAYGIRGTAAAPGVVPVDIEVRIVFVEGVTEGEQESIKARVKSAIERYIVSIPIGGTFILNELRQQIMDVSPKIRDHTIHCYYFREQPHLLGNVSIAHDEMFYPNPDSAEAIRVV
jgi:uncharacterized phage protein gp47/JayE